MRVLRVGDSDARLIEPVLHADERGSFARSWCAESFAAAGFAFTPLQGNVSLTRGAGTLRGMHFQRDPRPDPKVVRCSLGRIHDVIVDLRAGSPTRGQAFAHVLDGARPQMLCVPGGFAHGFQLLSEEAVVEYLMGEVYVPALYDGFRHDDPALGLAWPLPVRGLSEKDRAWPDLAGRFPWLAERAHA